MAKIRRGGYVFMTWAGDHSPRHVHVFKDEREILKWDLETSRVICGEISARIRRLIDQLVAEGRL